MINQRVFYGNVILERRYCNYCEKYSIVVDKEFQCCDAKVLSQENEKFEDKREAETVLTRKYLTVGDKKRILVLQKYKCFYCECSLVVNSPVFDHVSPFSFSGNNSYTNFVACCNDCNLLKSDKVFETRTEAENDFVERSKRKKENRYVHKQYRLRG